MKTIKVERFNGLEDCEEMEVARNALDIYKFFKLINGDFDIVEVRNYRDFQSVVDYLCNFLPFVKRNYDTIISFDEEEDDDYAEVFLFDIDKIVEETIRKNNLNVTITSNDIAKYSEYSSEIMGSIEDRIDDADKDDLIEFLKKRGLLGDFYTECCC